MEVGPFGSASSVALLPRMMPSGQFHRQRHHRRPIAAGSVTRLGPDRITKGNLPMPGQTTIPPTLPRPP